MPDAAIRWGSFNGTIYFGSNGYAGSRAWFDRIREYAARNQREAFDRLRYPDFIRLERGSPNEALRSLLWSMPEGASRKLFPLHYVPCTFCWLPDTRSGPLARP